ncbi:MAG: 4-hydroxy-tetrahydrodipicolinate synthase [Candidatus Acididesulfobacter diazotrophicus]|jgi:4-hydroxy-tetrahydrodipicolinate synthase|uniref:4-hydroxy-tetrahydrodipicolinate synthase n=1 Tax=Candidatus Acididesulfobacter diazotrophicus TaxID=2597226 RepID=A0A519BP95_9DELT|nr:MAG: 4-hydroxy-tetrahydrodipicolinate synthase [Candidatus Acididesulfobacter diazotrophicus]
MFKGIYTAIVTPFKSNKIDENSLEKLIEFQIKNGVSGIVACGSTGESATLSFEEHIRVIELAAKFAAGRVKVLAGTGSNNTNEAVELVKEAEKLNIDGHLQITPYYNKPTQEGLYLHFKKIAENAKLPIILYNVPTRTAVNILPETVLMLAKIDNIKGIKEASGSIEQVTAILRSAPEDFYLLSGDDAMTLPIIAIGGHGVISTVSNVAPKDMSLMADYCFKGDYKSARKLNFKLLPLIHAMFIETNPIPVKKALNIMGFIENEIRLPLSEPAGSTIEKINQALKDYGII